MTGPRCPRAVAPGSRREATLVGGLLMGGFVGGALLIGVPAVLVTTKALEFAAAARRRAALAGSSWRDLL